MAFTPRTTCPTDDNKWYKGTSYGGYNPFKVRWSSGSTLSNCVAYAWGRFGEIMGVKPALSTSNACDWYGYTKDGYKRSSLPQPGAVICWKGDTYGHVGIVEKVYSDSSYKYPKILTSESSWSASGPTTANKFWTQYRGGNNYGYSYNNKVCQGFILNPAVSGSGNKLTEFLSIAQQHSSGEDGTWAWKTAGHTVNQPWCATFVTACAKSVDGLIGTVLCDTAWAGGFNRWGATNNIGASLDGPWLGQQSQPQRGDLITFRYSSSSSSSATNIYYADHVGIVYSVVGDTVYTYEGNVSNGVSGKRSYNWKTNTTIYKYYRPDWSKVGVLDVNDTSYTTSDSSSVYGTLYTTQNDDNDAIVRELGFLNSLGEPSIQTSDRKLSVINYTTLLNSMFSSLTVNGAYGSYSTADNTGISTDALNSVARSIVSYFCNKGLSVAFGIGICANVQAECGFKIGISAMDTNGKMSGGIVMWNATNLTNMAAAVPDWRTNLTGQLDYLWDTMTSITSYKSFVDYKCKSIYGYTGGLLSYMSQQPNTKAGAQQVARIFDRCYEVSAGSFSGSTTRIKYAGELWDKLVITR